MALKNNYTSYKPNTMKEAVKKGQKVGSQKSTSSRDNKAVKFMPGKNK
jgi:hypothetical protein